jgi:Methyltransferase domain
MWDDRYSQEGFSYGTEPNDYLKSVAASTLNMPTGARVLMLADGEGRNGVFMAERGFDVTCVDLSAVGLQKAQALASSRGVTVETIVTDLGTYEFGVDRWDCVVGISSQLPPAIRERVLSLIPPSVKPNGYVVFEGYTPDQLNYKTGGPPSADMMYSSEIFSKAFGNVLDVLQNQELVRDVCEGDCHTGKAAVVQFVGRKP